MLAADAIRLNSAVASSWDRSSGQAWTWSRAQLAFPDLRFTADVVVCDGEFVAGRWTMTGTNTGVFDLFGLPPTGCQVTMTGQEIFRVRDGKFAEVWHQEDGPGMLASSAWSPRRPSCA